MTYAPIVLFVYNRLKHLTEAIRALQKNVLASESELFVFSDAAKTQEHQQSVADVRHYLKSISGFKKIVIKEQEKNLGLAQSIIRGVTETLNVSDKVIVLEDDLITDRYFLQFMNDALTKYENDPHVGSVHGYVYPVKKSLAQNFFLRYADCWGWGTWRRGWDLFEPDGKILLNTLEKTNQIKKFDFDDAFPYCAMLKEQIRGNNNSWAIRWQASLFLANKLSVYPPHALIQNKGNDNSGTHCGKTNMYDVVLIHQPIIIVDVPIAESRQAYHAFKSFFRTLYPKQSRLLCLIKKYVKKFFYLGGKIKNHLKKLFTIKVPAYNNSNNKTQKSSDIIRNGDMIIAFIVRNSFSKSGISFFTPNDFSQQLGYMHHPTGKIIEPHVHNPVTRSVLFTKEVLFIKKGKLRVDFYSDEQVYLESKILEAGDVILLARGGHGFEILEEVEMFEVKQGPYAGEQDKTRFSNSTLKNITINQRQTHD